MSKPSTITTILREPLFHFLLIGVGLFFIYAQMNVSEGEIEEKNEQEIHITQINIDKLSNTFLDNKGRLPTKEEQNKLISTFVQEEVLYREALKKGLDKDDDTIRLHLAKKMKFVFDDLSFTKKATTEDLEKFLTENSAMFIEPASISFNQVLFTKTKDSKDINIESKKFLERLENSKSTKISTIGDKVEMNEKSMTKIFGVEFVKSIFALPVHTWQGPIKTKHGIHLVYVHSKIEAKVPELSEIKDNVAIAWREEKMAEVNKVFYKELYKNYDIIIDGETKK